MTENDPACSECHHLFNLKTGELVKGKEMVYVVSPGPLLCAGCKASIIETLEHGLKA